MTPAESGYRMVVAVDDSPQAMVALRWAEAHLVRMQAQGRSVSGVVMTVWSPPVVDVRGLFDDSALARAATELLDRFVAELDHPDLFAPVTRRGPTAASILAEASERAADLIVVGSRGRSAIAQLLLGSVSRHVAGRADQPVAIVPETTEVAAAADPFTTIVAYDDSPGSRAALQWALDNTHGPIKALAAWTMPNTVVYDPTDPQTLAVEEQTTTTIVDGLREVGGGTIDPRVEPMVVHDDPRIALLDPALGGAMVVMGARGHSGFKGLLLGSTVNYIAGHAPLPVIVVPPLETT